MVVTANSGEVVWKVQFEAFEASLVIYQMASMLVGEVEHRDIFCETGSTEIIVFAAFGSEMVTKMLQMSVLDPFNSGSSTDGQQRQE